MKYDVSETPLSGGIAGSVSPAQPYYGKTVPYDGPFPTLWNQGYVLAPDGQLNRALEFPTEQDHESGEANMPLVSPDGITLVTTGQYRVNPATRPQTPQGEDDPHLRTLYSARLYGQPDSCDRSQLRRISSRGKLVLPNESSDIDDWLVTSRNVPVPQTGGILVVKCKSCPKCMLSANSRLRFDAYTECLYWQHATFITLTYKSGIKYQDSHLGDYLRQIRQLLKTKGQQHAYVVTTEFQQNRKDQHHRGIHYHILLFHEAPIPKAHIQFHLDKRGKPTKKLRWPHATLKAQEIVSRTITSKSFEFQDTKQWEKDGYPEPNVFPLLNYLVKYFTGGKGKESQAKWVKNFYRQESFRKQKQSDDQSRRKAEYMAKVESGKIKFDEDEYSKIRGYTRFRRLITSRSFGQNQFSICRDLSNQVRQWAPASIAMTDEEQAALEDIKLIYQDIPGNDPTRYIQLFQLLQKHHAHLPPKTKELLIKYQTARPEPATRPGSSANFVTPLMPTLTPEFMEIINPTDVPF